MAAKKTSIPIRFKKLRHWKQRFDKNAKFVWRRSLKFGGKRTTIGNQIPKSLLEKPTKLRRFWEAGVIELRDFEAPKVSTGKVAEKKAEPEVVADKAADKKAAAAAKRAKKKADKLAKKKPRTTAEAAMIAADKEAADEEATKIDPPADEESTNDEAT